jgi:hypothetical protein
MSTNQLSRRGAVVMGLLFIVCGVPAILIALGVVPASNPDPETPAWVGASTGLLFVVAGLTIILDFAIAGGVGPDGDFVAGTPFAIRLGNFLLGMSIVGLMTAVFGWVAFGPGTRHFSSTISVPFLAVSHRSGEMSGRIAFGVATALMAAMFVGCGVVGVERLWRARRP